MKGFRIVPEKTNPLFNIIRKLNDYKEEIRIE